MESIEFRMSLGFDTTFTKLAYSQINVRVQRKHRLSMY